MMEPSKYLEKSWKRRTDETRQKALKAIEELKKRNEPVNFSAVQKKVVYQSITYTSTMISEL